MGFEMLSSSGSNERPDRGMFVRETNDTDLVIASPALTHPKHGPASVLHNGPEATSTG